MIREHYRTPARSLLHEAADVDATANFDGAHAVFADLLKQVDANMLELPQDPELEQRVRDAWSRYECILEAERAMDVLEASDPARVIEEYDLLPRYQKFLETDRFLLRQCIDPSLGDPHLLMVGSGPLPITSYIFEREFGHKVTNVDASAEALDVGKRIITHAGMTQEFVHATGSDVVLDPSVTGVIVAALAGSNKLEKMDIISHISSQLQPGARLSVRYGTGVRQLFYPGCDLDDGECHELGLKRVGGFEPPRDYMNAIGVYEKC